MRLTILGSGSKGNAMHVEAAGTRVLVDAGLSFAELERRAVRFGIDVRALDAIVLTHAHGDHVGYVKAYARAIGCPVYMTEATQRSVRVPGQSPVRVFGADSPFRIGALAVSPCTIPHDAPQVALVFDDGQRKAAIVTDLGHAPARLIEHLADVDVLLLESNYDARMLEAGPYPAWLKKRVAGPHGHLDNRDAAAVLRALAPRLRLAVLMHLSQQNNDRVIAEQVARAALEGSQAELLLSAQDEPLALDLLALDARAAVVPLREVQLPLSL